MILVLVAPVKNTRNVVVPSEGGQVVLEMLKILFQLGLVFLLLLLLPYFYIGFSTRSDCTSVADELGEDLLLVVLGTSRNFGDGRTNLFYRYRIEAAVRLYETGKVSEIIVSGHGLDKYYNEPREMEKDLVAAGVPQERIRRDVEGQRTILSVRGLTEEGPEQNIVFVSQRFHNLRAVYLARRQGIQAKGYDAGNPPAKYMIRILAREVLARQLAFWETLFDK